MMTEAEQEWAAHKRAIYRTTPPRDEKTYMSRPRHLMHQFVNHKAFEKFILACILLNTLILSLTHFQMDDNFEKAIESLNFAFLIVFSIEATLELYV